ncbi:MAG: hypothetical protein H6605_00035 [Flavobacteriales bacterium]|nr:hypothetical protein [Flavobacteriales bacterium]
MKSLILLGLLGSLLFQSCRDKDPEPIKTTLELSAEMISYFVNFEVGTKWIYQDTINKTNFDTIELISKENMDVNDGSGTLSKGFVLYYKPKKSKDFKVFVSPGNSGIHYVKVDPLVTAAGKIVFENNNGIWTTGVTYYDSIELNKIKYYNVIESNSKNSYQYLMKISKSTGMVFFYHIDGGSIIAAYTLIKMHKP